MQANSPCIGSGRYGGDRGALPHQTGIKDNPARPAAFGMPGNYPNPFNSSTMIKYTLPSAGDVRIEIFDISGGRIHTVYLSDQPAGEHSFLWQADNQPSGVYFYKISTNEYVRTNRMVLVK